MAGYKLELSTAKELADMLRDYKRRFKNIQMGEQTKDYSLESNPVEIVKVTGSAIANGSQPGTLIGLGFDPSTGAAILTPFQEISILSLSGPLAVGTLALGCLIADFWVVGGGPGGMISGGSGTGSGSGVVSGGSGSGASSGPPGTIQVVTDISCVNGVLNVTKRWIYGAFA